MAMTATGAMADDNISVWDGSSYSSSLTVDGKKIYVRSANDFAALRKLWKTYKGVSGSDGSGYDTYTIYLETDIDLGNHNFINWCIGWENHDENEFGGHFDGQGHIIYNLKIEGSSANRGLFGILNGGNVRNLKLVNVDIHSGDDNSHVGALCGKMENHSSISHCAVLNGSVRAYHDGDTEIGAICGYADGNENQILYCYSNVEVTANKLVGGIVGKVDKDEGDDSVIRNCYFSGKINHKGNEYFGAIAGRRYSNPMSDNFYLYRDDGVKGVGNQSKYHGSNDPTEPEIKACTEEELKQPLLFRNYNKGYTLESDQYVYPFNGYPELKVFLRYDVGDSFYVTNAGHMGENTADSIPGHVRILKNDKSPFTVTLEKAGAATSATDFVVNETFTPYFNDQQLLKTVGLGANVFQDLGEVNTVTIPAAVDSVATPQRHQVQKTFILNGDASQGAVKDNVLYSLKTKYLLTAPKSLTTMTIHQELADSIADYAFENMTALKTLYVDTYTPAGTLVDDKDNKAPTMKFQGEKNTVFYGCPDDLDVYIKDGTFNQLVYGQLGPRGYGYSNADVWYLFVGYWEDQKNHMFPYFPISRNEGGMSTMILGYPVELPEGVTAWWATSLSNGNVNLQKLGTQIVPALTPVLLTYEGTEPLYLTRYTGPNPGNVNDYENNLFKGSVDPGGHNMTSSELMSNFFTLGRPAGDNSYNQLGFYQYHPKNNILPAYVAWLANNDIPSEMRLLANFNDDATLINNSTLKPSLNGEKQVYTMQGIRIAPSTMRKGNMYIVNGKLVINR